jgi:hypothetical protein
VKFLFCSKLLRGASESGDSKQNDEDWVRNNREGLGFMQLGQAHNFWHSWKVLCFQPPESVKWEI